MVARVLVAQNTHATAGAEQFDHGLKAVFAIKEFKAGATTGAPHMRVDEAIAKLLVHAGVSHVTDELGHQLGKQLPNSEMA